MDRGEVVLVTGSSSGFGRVSVERLARALREREPGQSPTDAVVHAIMDDTWMYQEAPDALMEFVPLFGAMIDSTPALRAAWLELHARLAKVAS